jgi:hypothetical protein
MWSTLAGGHLMKVVNLTGFTVFSCSGTNIRQEIFRGTLYAQLGFFLYQICFKNPATNGNT